MYRYRQPKAHEPPNSLRIVGHAYRTFARIVDAQLRELGFAMSQLPVLIVLKQGKPMPQAELARIARVEQSSMAQLLNRMERDGLVERVADPTDKRSRLISLTDLASRRMHKGKAMAESKSARLFKDFKAHLEKTAKTRSSNFNSLAAVSK
jgi:MarR family transcriptional regulator for hemolysin